MFSVLCTPGYIKEKQEQWDSGHFFPPAWPDGIKPLCFNVSMLGKNSVYVLYRKVSLVLRELFLFLFPLAEASHRLPFCASFPRY